MKPVEIIVKYLNEIGSFTLTDDRGGSGAIIITTHIRCDYDDHIDLVDHIDKTMEIMK